MHHGAVAAIRKAVALLPRLLAIAALVSDGARLKLYLLDHWFDISCHIADEVHRIVVTRGVEKLNIYFVVAVVVDHEVGLDLDLSHFGRARRVKPVDDPFPIFLCDHHRGDADAATRAIVADDVIGQVGVLLGGNQDRHGTAVLLDVACLPDKAAFPPDLDHIEGSDAATLVFFPSALDDAVGEFFLHIAAILVGVVEVDRANLWNHKINHLPAIGRKGYDQN